MTVVAYLASVVTFAYVGYIFGANMRNIEASEMSRSQAYKEGYIKGYGDCWASVKKTTKNYYDDFPNMGIN